MFVVGYNFTKNDHSIYNIKKISTDIFSMSIYFYKMLDKVKLTSLVFNVWLDYLLHDVLKSWNFTPTNIGPKSYT